jgi:HEAT repeat protein
MMKQISISFNLGADVIQSIPFGTTSAINSLIDDLSSLDWETRWFAAFLLGDLKATQAKIPLENLSRIEQDKDVVKCTNWALNNLTK